MEARVKNHGEISIISIQGTLDIHQTQPFRDVCLRQFRHKKIIFDLEGASFVGSTGIQAFLETIKGLSEKGPFVKMVGLKSEFKRIFQNLELPNLEICESQNQAIEAFSIGFTSPNSSFLD